MYKFQFGPKKDLPKEVIKKGIFFGFMEFVYILLVALFFMAGEAVFPVKAGNAILGIMAFLFLFVVSAAISGALVLGQPLCLVFQKKYREAVVALTATIITLVAFLVLLIIGALLF